MTEAIKPRTHFDYWDDPYGRLARMDAEVERWWEEIPVKNGSRWSGDAKRPAPQFGLKP